ncbi:MAG: PQQ-binding-like beta-propeller repeat protein, partial [Gemmataceae bacterium]
MRNVAALSGLLLMAAAAGGADWPCWRGPDHNGISPETGWLTQWPQAGPPSAWKTKVGLGFAALSVKDGLCYTTGNADEKDTVFCFDAVTGKEVWKHSYDAPLGDLYFQGGTTSTPTVHAGKLYQLSRWGDLFCLDAAKGKVLWSRQIAKEDKLPVPTWGFASAPRIHEKLVLLNVGKAGMALDKDTGKIVWMSDKEESGYSTPVLFQREGATFALVSSGKAFAAVDVHTGKPLWDVRWVSRYGVYAADPIVAGSLVFLSSG